MLIRWRDTRRQKNQIQALALQGSDGCLEALGEKTAQTVSSLLPDVKRDGLTGETQPQPVMTAPHDLLNLQQLRRVVFIPKFQ